MPTPAYLAELAKFNRTPIEMVRVTVPGDLVGSQVFRFSTQRAPNLSYQLGVDILPYLQQVGGRTTKLDPGLNTTEDMAITAVMNDDEQGPEFDSAVFTVFQGGSFFRRLKVAQPNDAGWKVEVLRGFIAPGFLESDFEPIFTGESYELGSNKDGSFSLKAKSQLRKAAVSDYPQQISDQNTVQGQVLVNDTSFSVVSGSEFTDYSAWDSKDYQPPCVRLNGTEDVIIKERVGNLFTVQDNYCIASEDFTDAAYLTGGVVVITANQAFSPFGGSISADRLQMSANAFRAQFTGIPAAGQSANYSVWIKLAPGSVDQEMTIIVTNSTVAEFNAILITLTDQWQRFDTGITFTGGAAGTIAFALWSTELPATPKTVDIFAYGNQLVLGTADKQFYAPTTATKFGAAAGRGAYGSSQVADTNPTIKEVLQYRNFFENDGNHPTVILQDLLIKSGVVVADFDLNSFGLDFNFSPSVALRRGNVSGFTDTTLIEPEKISKLIKQVKENSLIDLWVSEAGLFTSKGAWRAFLTTDVIDGITDDDALANSIPAEKPRGELRTTRVYIFYNIRLEKEGTENTDYNNGNISVDFAAETNAGVRSVVIRSKWIYRSKEALSTGGRILSRFSQGGREVDLMLDLKDDDTYKVGDTINFTSKFILVASGTSAVVGPSKWQVIKKTNDHRRGRISLFIMNARNKRFGLIAPSGTPDYDASSAAEKVYAFIGDTNNLLGAAMDDGYYIL